MRGCLTLLLGILVGIGAMLYFWPKQPAGRALPASSDVRVFVSDRYLSSLVQRHASSIDLPQVSDVHILSSPPAVLIATAQLSVGPISAPTSMELAPEIENGRVHIRIVSSTIAGIPIPDQFAGIVEGQINAAAGNVNTGAARITGVKVTARGLQITANAK